MKGIENGVQRAGLARSEFIRASGILGAGYLLGLHLDIVYAQHFKDEEEVKREEALRAGFVSIHTNVSHGFGLLMRLGDGVHVITLRSIIIDSSVMEINAIGYKGMHLTIDMKSLDDFPQNIVGLELPQKVSEWYLSEEAYVTPLIRTPKLTSNDKVIVPNISVDQELYEEAFEIDQFGPHKFRLINGNESCLEERGDIKVDTIQSEIVQSDPFLWSSTGIPAFLAESASNGAYYIQLNKNGEGMIAGLLVNHIEDDVCNPVMEFVRFDDALKEQIVA